MEASNGGEISLTGVLRGNPPTLALWLRWGGVLVSLKVELITGSDGVGKGEVDKQLSFW